MSVLTRALSVAGVGVLVCLACVGLAVVGGPGSFHPNPEALTGCGQTGLDGRPIRSSDVLYLPTVDRSTSVTVRPGGRWLLLTPDCDRGVDVALESNTGMHVDARVEAPRHRSIAVHVAAPPGSVGLLVFDDPGGFPRQIRLAAP